MALLIPSSLKLKHLKSLAFQCGISTSGSKTLLTNRLIDEIVPVSNHDPKSNLRRILSIDMGIRNLAYCILDLRPRSVPSVTAWRRITVSSAPTALEDNAVDPSLPSPKEVFDPPTLSAAAYTLLRHTLLPYGPTHILIERQRFRSMGSSHILEWTVRVNMFESMLYAVLQTLKSENIWKGTVIPIMPGKVGPFWIGSESAITHERADDAGSPRRRETKTRTAKTAKLLNKGAKIDIVKSWLEGKQMLSLGSEAELTAGAYLDKWHRLPGRRKGGNAEKLAAKDEREEMGKLDDLADCLLQGMAWIKWEDNRRRVLKTGVGALDLDKSLRTEP
jgi:cruciform cutting endonuclease 1